MSQVNTIRPRNDQAYALFFRAGNAGAAVAVDTRPKSIPNKKRKGASDRKKSRQSLRQGRWD